MSAALVVAALVTGGASALAVGVGETVAASSLIAVTLMFHHSLWFELEGGVEIKVSFSKEGVCIQLTSSLLEDYEEV